GLFPLSPFLICTAVDEIIEAATSIYPQIMVTMSCMPETGFGDRSRWKAGTKLVAVIERQFRLKKCCCGNMGQTYEGIVCCHNHTIEIDPTAIDLDAALFRIEFARRVFFENVGAVARNFSSQRAMIFPWMKLCLIGISYTWQIAVGNRFQISCIESEFRSKAALFL